MLAIVDQRDVTRILSKHLLGNIFNIPRLLQILLTHEIYFFITSRVNHIEIDFSVYNLLIHAISNPQSRLP